MVPPKPFLFLGLILFCCKRPEAQVTCVPVYVNEYSSSGQLEPYTLKPLPDGTFLIAGRGTANGTGPYDGMVMQVSSTGTILWSYLIGGSGDDAFTGIAPLSDGSFVLSGSTASYGHPESKGWLVHISATGTMIWSRQIGSLHTGTDRIKAIQQYSDNDIIATFNEDDSSSSSNPVVFKMGLDGTLRWSTKFDNGDDDSYTSIALSGNTVYASGYYSAGSKKKAVITQIDASSGSQILSRTIYRDDPVDQEIAGLEIYNNIISYGLWLHGLAYPQFDFNNMVLVQTDLSNVRRMVVYASNGGDASVMMPFRTRDGGFYVLRSDPTAYSGPSICKVNSYGSTSWGHLLNNYAAQANMATAVTADNGCISALFFKNFSTNNINQMRLVRMTSAGENGDCQLPSIGLFTDTLAYNELPFTWQTIAAENTDNTVRVPDEAVNSPAMTNVCFTNLCIDKTPLPPGCNKTYRIEYSGPELQFFRDAITTTDGGRIAVGEIASSSDGLAVKMDVNGQPVWSKRFESFFRAMKFMRILRSPDNNYWIFANDYLDLNHQGSRYIDLLKIDGSGNILWSRQLDMGWNGMLLAEIADVAPTPDGGFVLMVNDGWGSGSIYSYAMRYDANLNIVWQKEITHPASTPVYKSVTVSSDAVFLAYESYEYSNLDKFGIEKLDLKTGNLQWSNRYSAGTGNVEMINRIFSIHDTTYTFVNNSTPLGAFSSITNSILVKLDPQGNLFESLFLNGENMIPPTTYYEPDVSPPTVVMTAENDFVLCSRADINGVKKLNLARFDKSGNALWSRNFEAMNNHTPLNIHQQGKGFLVVGSVDVPHPGLNYWKDGFLLKVDSSGQIMNNATGECQQVNRSFTSAPGPVSLTWLTPRQSIDLTGPAFKPFNITSGNVEADPTAYCIQKQNCGTVGLKQKGNGCSMNDTLIYFLQDPSSCDAIATWQYDTTYFHALYADGDSILLRPAREGVSTVTATIEGNCFLETKNMQTSVLHPASALDLGPDTLLCSGNSMKLSAGPGFAGYRWNDNSSDSTLMISTAGKYYVDVADHCGANASDTIVVRPADFAFRITGDSISCNHETAEIQASEGFKNYQWSPADHLTASGSQAKVNPDGSTQYKVTAEKFPGCMVADSVLIKALTSPAIALRADTSLCSGDSLFIQAPAGFVQYAWSTGDSTQFLFAKNKGNYTVRARYSNGCVSTGAFQMLEIYDRPSPGLDKNPVLCAGSSRELIPGHPFENYLWNNGSTGMSISVDALGTYWLQVEDRHGCFGTDTVEIRSVGQLPSAFLPADTVICQFGELDLTANKTFRQYTWDDQSGSPALHISQPGIYWLKVLDENNCEGNDSIVVTQKQCLIGLYTPNAFTPDHSGHNDVFRPVIMGNVSYFDFQVFNRWGQKVFETQTPGAGWDGNIGGLPSVADTYVWICRYSLSGQEMRTERGSVVLIR